MRVRGILGGIVTLALVVAPGTAADEPAQAAAAGESAAGALPRLGTAPAELKVRFKGASDGEVRVGERVQAVGRVRPFVPGQRIRLLVKRGSETIKRKVAPLRQVRHENVGDFKIRLGRLVEPGTYRVRAKKLATPEQDGAHGGTGGITVDYPDLDPGDHSSLVRIFNNLLEKQAYHTTSGEDYGSATGRAVLAFRKVNGMERTSNATAGIFRALAAGKGRFRLKWPEGGKHVETDLSRQVMVLANNGKPQHIFHISSGAPATPTVRGKFPVYRFDAGYNDKGMYYSAYFHGGYATHGYHSVPTYPASHGCLRNPIPDSIFIYKWLDYGDVFYVYG